MAFVDTLTDMVTLQQATTGADGGYGSPVETWTSLRTFPCRAVQMSSRQLQVYERNETTGQGITFYASDLITRTLTHESLFSLLNAAGQDTFRLLYRGKTMTILGYRQQSQGMHNTMANIVQIDTEEAPEVVGRMDA